MARVETDRERGQAVVGVIMWIAIAAILAVGLGRVGEAVIDRTRATTAADAAALAGAADTDQAARETVRRNNAEIVAITRVGEEVQVVVRVGRSTATARAERVQVPG